MSNWYSAQGSNSDVVISSSVKLIRNMADTPFSWKMSHEMRKSACKKIYALIKNSSFAGDFEMSELDSISTLEKVALIEKGLLSVEEGKQNAYSALVASSDEAVSILLCGEDHIQLNSRLAGQSLEKAYEIADELDNIFINGLNIAFDERLGFLSPNPINIGTGMQASLVLHLPAIYSRGMLPSLSNMVNKLGFSIKPLFSDDCAIFKLSNRVTMGITEKSAIENLNAICDQIANQERELRQALLSQSDYEDKIFRAMGTLKMARMLSSKELFNMISLIRLGISTGSFDNNYEEINNMLYSLGSATIMCESDIPVSADDVDKTRADYVRDILK